jgi:hypothetical protein
MIRKEKPLVSIAEEIMKGKPGTPLPKPIRPGKPKPVRPGKPVTPERPDRPGKPLPFQIMAKRMNDPNGFYYN